jgi:DNA mismatch repair protein MutS2
VDRSIASDVEFDKVLQLIAAHARSGVGRIFLERSVVKPHPGGDPDDAARLVLALTELIEDDETLSFAGVDDALPWLEDDAPPPSEPRDLLALLGLAKRVAAVRRRFGAAASDRLRALAEKLPDTTELVAAVSPRLNADGTVADSASSELQRLRREVGRARTDVTAELDGIRRAHGDVVTDAPPTLRRDRYCLPVRSSARGQLPGLLLDVSARGATAFVEPLAVVELNNRLTAATAGERREIQRILAEIARQFAAAHDDLAAAVEVLAEIDAVQAKVLFGRRVDGRVVLPAATSELVLRGARHPLLDERLHALRVDVFGDMEQRDPGHRVVPLDFAMPEGIRTLVVSGPNAGGKTVVLKTIGLMVLMSQHGIPLPVDEGTAIPDFSRLWCHIGDEQNVAADLSTFSGSMAATARLLDDADDTTLVLFDELGAGTDPLEGAAIGCALLEELSNRGAVTVVSTHLAAIALSANSANGMENAAVEYDEDTQRPTYVLAVGRPGRSRALEIADRVGVSHAVLERARELLGGDHLELDRWLRRLENLEMQLEAERSEVALLRAETDGYQQEARRELQKLENERLALPEVLAAERDELRRRAKKKLDAAITRLQSAVEEHEALGRRRLQKLRDEALDLDDRQVSPTPSTGGLEVGARVRLAVGGKGVLREIRGSQARVEVAGKKLWVPVGELQVVAGPPPAQQAAVRVETVDPSDRELKLIGLDREHAREELERFLDRASTSGLPAVRVVHGHGTGTLRRLVTEICRSHPSVRSFRHPPQHRGGTGATEVELGES